MLHKSEVGYIDLTFEGAKEKLIEIDKMFKDTFGGYERIGAMITVTEKSVVLRTVVPALDFKKTFEEQMDKVEKCFEVIQEMTELANKLDAVKVIQILNK